MTDNANAPEQSARRRWQSMKQRCLNPNNAGYKNYGGRGIKVCYRWLNSFQAFLDDMGLPPPGLSIDRINNDGDYEPGNCRWADAFTQNNNQRPPDTHCTAGHELTPENTRITSRNRRECRTCHKARASKSRAQFSPATRAALENLAAGRPGNHGFNGRGYPKTLSAMLRNGLAYAMNGEVTITDAGRAAIAITKEQRSNG